MRCWLAATVLATAACGFGDPPRAVVTVYSPHAKELLAHFEEAFERIDSTVDVQWVDMGSPEVLDRLRAERAAPQADLWFGAPADLFDRAAAEGLLQAYRPTWADRVPADARHPEDRWYGTYLTPAVIAYHRDSVPAANAPRDWEDIVAKRFNGKVVLRDPMTSGTMRTLFGTFLARALAASGGTTAAWDYLRRLDAVTREYALSPAGLTQKLARGEAWLTVYNLPDIASLRDRTGAAVEFVLPASGTPVALDGIALVAGAPQREAAVRFYEYVTSPAALVHAARAFHRLPVRDDLPADDLPPWVATTRAALRPLPVDRRVLADSLDGWMVRWDSTIRAAGRPR